MTGTIPRVENHEDTIRYLIRLLDKVGLSTGDKGGLSPILIFGVPGAETMGCAANMGDMTTVTAGQHQHAMPQLYQDLTTWVSGQTSWALTTTPNPSIVFLFADHMLLIPGVDYTLSTDMISIVGDPLNAGVKMVALYLS
jgi:hypothetical protein